LPAAELAARLAEAYELIGELTAQVGRLSVQVEDLKRQARRDLSTSSRPPSSDSPYRKGADRSLRERGKRRPGKQRGGTGSTMCLVGDPDESFDCPPGECRGCGTDLAGEPVLAQRPAGHHIPVYRATLLLCQLAGVAVSAGWMAGIRGRAAALVEASGFTDRVRELLKTAPAVHADETPARAAGGTRYVHLACTRYLTCMHTGDRSADAIDSRQVLPGYHGVIVRDGYAGYGHLTDALHAWCGVHLLRDLKGLYEFEPGKQDWASQMACLLIEARHAASAARLAAQTALDPAVLDDLVTRYRELAAAGLAGSLYRRTATAKDARRIARRFLSFEDLILRFAARPDLDIFSNNEAERTIRPVKVQQRSSGGSWRTLDGLAEFALVQSYLSTARKWGICKLDALRSLFDGSPWLPPGLEPAG
jgi:transposase